MVTVVAVAFGFRASNLASVNGQLAIDEAEARAKADRKTEEAKRQETIAKNKTTIANAARQQAEKDQKIAEDKTKEAEAAKKKALTEYQRAETERDAAEKARGRAQMQFERAEREREAAEIAQSKAEEAQALAERAQTRAERESERADRERDRAEKERAVAVAGRYQIALARVNDLRQDDPELAMQILLSIENCPDELRDFTWSYLFAFALDSPARKQAVAAVDERVTQWRLSTPANVLEFSPNSDLLACGLGDGAIEFRDRVTGKIKYTLRGHDGAVRSLRFAPDGATLVSGGDDKTVRLWDLKTQKLRTVLKGHTAAVVAIDISSDGSLIVSGAGEQQVENPTEGVGAAPAIQDGEVKLWNLKTATERAGVELPTEPIRAVSFYPGASTLVFVQSDGEMARQTSEERGEAVPFRKLKEDQYRVDAIALSPDGGLLAALARKKDDREKTHLVIWDDRDPVVDNQSNRFPHITDAGEESRDVLQLVERFIPGSVKLSSAMPAAVESVWFEQRGVLKSLAFSANGRTLATGDSEGRIQLRDGATGQVRLTLRSHNDPVRSLTFAPNGTALASTSTTSSNQAVVVIHNGLDGAAKIIAYKPDYWRQAYEMMQLRIDHAAGSVEDLHAMGTFLAAAEAELAWEADNHQAAARRMADAIDHAKMWVQVQTASWRAGLNPSLDHLAYVIEMRYRIDLASLRVNQSAKKALPGFDGIESSRLPVLRDVTGGLPVGKIPAMETRLLDEKVEALDRIFRFMRVGSEEGILSVEHSYRAGYHLEVGRAALAWAKGDLAAAVKHIELAVGCSLVLCEMLEIAAQVGRRSQISASHARSQLVNARMTLARLKQHQRGTRFSPSLADILERTSFEVTGDHQQEEVKILERTIEALEPLAKRAAALRDARFADGQDYDRVARRLERMKADLAWIHGDQERTRHHLKAALAHAERAAHRAERRLREGIVDPSHSQQQAVIDHINAKLDLARLDRLKSSTQD